MQQIIEKIEQADDFEIQKIMETVERRYALLFPDWEVVYIAVHKEPALRRSDLQRILTMLEKEKTDSLG